MKMVRWYLFLLLILTLKIKVSPMCKEKPATSYQTLERSFELLMVDGRWSKMVPKGSGYQTEGGVLSESYFIRDIKMLSKNVPVD